MEERGGKGESAGEKRNQEIGTRHSALGKRSIHLSIVGFFEAGSYRAAWGFAETGDEAALGEGEEIGHFTDEGSAAFCGEFAETCDDFFAEHRA